MDGLVVGHFVMIPDLFAGRIGAAVDPDDEVACRPALRRLSGRLAIID
jgi:hypothetical protein